MSVHSQRANIEAEIRRLQGRLVNLNMLPDDDTYGDGTIVRADVQFGSTEAKTYVFLKIVNKQRAVTEVRWYFTGLLGRGWSHIAREQRCWLTWDELTRWVGDRTVLSWDVMLSMTHAQMNVVRVVLEDETAAGMYEFHRQSDGTYQ